MALDIKRLRTDFAAAAKDGKITDTDVDGLLKRVKRNGLTESEAKTLKAETARYKDQFTVEGSKKMTDFIEHKLRGLQVLDDPTPVNPLGVKDPAVLKADLKKVRQTELKGSALVKNGVNGDDVMQKYLGDCYLIAAMAATARVNPELIEQAFSKRSDGTYDVTIYQPKGRGFTPVKVHIDADLPHNDWYGLEYASARDEKELWPALLEKAFAAKAGSYGKLEGGVPGEAMSWLTGKPSNMIDFKARGVKADQVFDALSLAMKEQRPATASTYGDSSSAKYTNSGLYADHAYSVWGTEVSGGKKYVQLRNPWGDSEPANNGKDDGIFKMELSEFMKMYANVEINGA